MDKALFIIKLSQSQREFKIDDSLDIEIDHVESPVGKNFFFMFNTGLKNSIVQIRNSDKYCLTRALVVAEAKYKNGLLKNGNATARQKAVRQNWDGETTRNNINQQKRVDLKLFVDSSVEISEGGCKIPEIKKFREFYA